MNALCLKVTYLILGLLLKVSNDLAQGYFTHEKNWKMGRLHGLKDIQLFFKVNLELNYISIKPTF